MSDARSEVRRAGVLALLIPVWFAGCQRAGPPAIGGEPIEVEEGVLGVAMDEGSRELVLELRPVDLPANAGHRSVEQPAPLEGSIEVDGWVNGYRVELVDAAGQPVPQAVLHHVNIIVPGRRELFSQIMQRLGAAGQETEPVQLPRLLGYPLSRGDRILLSAMLHNPTGTDYEGVRVRVRLPHIARNTLVRPIRVYPFYLDVMPPAGTHDFDLPPGHSEKTWEGRPAVSGRILRMSGHVHKYATSLRLENVTERRVIYEARPILDEAGNVVGMPQDGMLLRLGLPIHSEHTYRIVVEYENPTAETIPDGGMGTLGGVLILNGDDEWPAIDPKDPEYMKDVAVTMRLQAQAGADSPAEPQGESDEAASGVHSHY